jgi:hypothetical protein
VRLFGSNSERRNSRGSDGTVRGVSEIEIFFTGGPWDGQSVKTTLDGELPMFITWASSQGTSPSGAFVPAIVYRKRLDNAGTPLESREGLQAEYAYEGDTGSRS